MIVQLLIFSAGIAIGILAGVALHSALAGILAGVCVVSGATYMVLP
jgi:hypothetical protein